MLTLPTIHGIIRRRLLLNFRVDPAVLQRQLPDRLRPKLHAGYAVAGVCLIRLEEIRPAHVPGFAGLSSENGAHRFAVTWADKTGPREGVYIPRRDTSSLLNHLAGGRVFPGEHHRARFEVEDDGTNVALRMRADDDGVVVDVRAKAAAALPKTSIFADLDAASAFFAAGSVGYSVTHEPARLDGIQLVTPHWQVGALDVARVASSYFDDEVIFPKGSIAFDCGLVMRDVAHEWHAAPDLVVLARVSRRVVTTPPNNCATPTKAIIHGGSCQARNCSASVGTEASLLGGQPPSRCTRSGRTAGSSRRSRCASWTSSPRAWPRFAAPAQKVRR